MLDHNQPDPAETDRADAIARVAKALAHPARVRIVAFVMSRPGCIGGDIVDEVGLAQSTVSEHLRILKASGLVVGEIERPRICYSLDASPLGPLHALIGRIEASAQNASPLCYTPQNPRSRGLQPMTTLTVYDPPHCCATGVCGTDVDQQVVDFATDLDWMKLQGAEFRRINLSQEPMEFVSNPAIKALMDTAGADTLPAVLVGGAVISAAGYPARHELAKWAGVAGTDDTAAAASTSRCGGSESEDSEAASGCC